MPIVAIVVRLVTSYDITCRSRAMTSMQTPSSACVEPSAIARLVGWCISGNGVPFVQGSLRGQCRIACEVEKKICMAGAEEIGNALISWFSFLPVQPFSPAINSTDCVARVVHVPTLSYPVFVSLLPEPYILRGQLFITSLASKVLTYEKTCINCFRFKHDSILCPESRDVKEWPL